MTASIPIDLQTMLQKLDEPQARYAELDRYYTGTQPLAFLSPEAKIALGNAVRAHGIQHPPAGCYRIGRTVAHHRIQRSGAVDRLGSMRHGSTIRSRAS